MQGTVSMFQQKTLNSILIIVSILQQFI